VRDDQAGNSSTQRRTAPGAVTCSIHLAAVIAAWSKESSFTRLAHMVCWGAGNCCYLAAAALLGRQARFTVWLVTRTVFGLRVLVRRE